jgi:hypothetical protein
MSLAEMLERLAADEMQAALGSAVIGREIIVLDQTGSTNDAVLQIATPDSKEGLVLFAEHQTAGRGQRGNRWESAAAKGLWFSILLRPGIELNRSPQLTAWAAETISGAIENEFSLKTCWCSGRDARTRKSAAFGYRRNRNQYESGIGGFPQRATVPGNFIGDRARPTS